MNELWDFEEAVSLSAAEEGIDKSSISNSEVRKNTSGKSCVFKDSTKTFR